MTRLQMSEPYRSPTDLGRLQAKWLLAPSLFIVVIALFLLPNLFETGRRLDNEYWERQLHFATTSLVIAACGVPFVILRLFIHVTYLCLFGWLIVAAGYAAMTIYMIQSHFPFPMKIILDCFGVTGLLIAIRGLAADLKHKDTRL
jgi:hypothetical protein